jgi:hypothetical protein
MSNITPMTAGSVQHFVERAYRESGELQYLRELVVNAMEANATRIEFGPEWRAVERAGVYRLMVADNGRGMSPDELLKFLNTYGGGGKPIGDAHENYGVGSKTSLLPWNHGGVVIISWTPECPAGAMVWLERDASTGEYGARKIQTQGGVITECVQPFDNWADIKPDWIDAHGTVVICLGNSPDQDTFLGKGGKGDIKAISAYLNKRLWEIPEGVTIHVSEMRSQKKEHWPRSFAEATAAAPRNAEGQIDRRRNYRRIEGAKHFIHKPGPNGTLAEFGSVALADGTLIDWFLWQGERPAVHSYAHKSGYVAALYKNELYDTRQHVSTFRSFGIPLKDVRDNLTLVARPKLTDGKEGVYPDTARNALKIQGTNRAGEGLPWDEWAQEFADSLPEPIRKALTTSGGTKQGTLKDPSWSQRLIDRFGSRWESVRFVANPAGTERIQPDLPRGGPARRDGIASDTTREGCDPRPGFGGANAGQPVAAAMPLAAGPVTASRAKVRGGVPEYAWTTLEELSDDDHPAAAAWNPPSASHPSGLVQLARDFSAIVEVKAFWQAQYPDHYADKISEVVEEVYGEAMAGRIAHSERLASDPLWGRSKVDKQLRSTEALTMALLGLVSEDTVISNRLRGLGVKRKAA